MENNFNQYCPVEKSQDRLSKQVETNIGEWKVIKCTLWLAASKETYKMANSSQETAECL